MITPARKLTYLGVPATLVTFRMTRGADRRVEILTWGAKAVGQPVEYEAGTVVLRLVTGKGYKTQTKAVRVMDPGTSAAQAEDAARELLAA